MKHLVSRFETLAKLESSYIRDIDFEPFAFRINADSLPESVQNYQLKQTTSQKGFDYQEVSEGKHREALANLFSEAELVSYGSLIGKLQKSYASVGYSFGTNKANLLKVFLENKRMIVKEEKSYRFNPVYRFRINRYGLG